MTSPYGKWHLKMRFRCAGAQCFDVQHDIKYMVRSTLLWGGGLGRPKAGNRPICNISWKMIEFDDIFVILASFHQSWRQETRIKKSSGVMCFRFIPWMQSDIDFLMSSRCVSASRWPPGLKNWCSQKWPRMIQVMFRSHLTCSRMILGASGWSTSIFENHENCNQDDVSVRQMTSKNAISLCWRTMLWCSTWH